MHTYFREIPQSKLLTQKYLHQDLRSSPPKKKKVASNLMTLSVSHKPNITRAFLSWLVVEPTHLKNMLVKLDHLPKDRDENSKNI